MRILICGSRHANPQTCARRVIDILEKDGIEKVETFIHGGANGADEAADIVSKVLQYTHQCSYPPMEFKADWDQHGRGAGPIRNQKMINKGKPHLVIAFPDVDSKGTLDMIRRSQKAGIRTIIEDFPIIESVDVAIDLGSDDPSGISSAASVVDSERLEWAEED